MQAAAAPRCWAPSCRHVGAPSGPAAPPLVRVRQRRSHPRGNAPASSSVAPAAAATSEAAAAFADLAAEALDECRAALQPCSHGNALVATVAVPAGGVVLRVPLHRCLVVDYAAGMRLPAGQWPRLNRGVQKDAALPWDILQVGASA